MLNERYDTRVTMPRYFEPPSNYKYRRSYPWVVPQNSRQGRKSLQWRVTIPSERQFHLFATCFASFQPQPRGQSPEKNPRCRVNAHNFTLQRRLGIGLLDRISRKEESGPSDRCPVPKRVEWTSLRQDEDPGGLDCLAIASEKMKDRSKLRAEHATESF